MTQKKDNRLPILDENARCVCGAETYDPEKRPHGAVGGWVRVDGHRLMHWHTGWGRRSNMAR